MSKNITEMIRKIAEVNMPTIVTGRVLSLEPLRVQLRNDASIRLSAQSLIVPTDRITLAVGDELYMLSVNRNKIYYVLDKM